MTYILHLETATKNCSVALSKNGELIATRELAETGFTHAENLHLFIQQVLLQAKITPQQLQAVAVSQGPGSYTGLRIGVATAKGLCYTLAIPLIAINTLEILSRKITIKEGYIIPMIDARRMECYTAVFNQNYEIIRATEAQIITPTLFDDYIKPIHLVGDGIQKCKPILTDTKFQYHETIIFPSAQEMIALAHKKYENQVFENIAYFEPFYLKDFYTTPSKNSSST